jgi:hypothetical protein
MLPVGVASSPAAISILRMIKYGLWLIATNNHNKRFIKVQ